MWGMIQCRASSELHAVIRSVFVLRTCLNISSSRKQRTGSVLYATAAAAAPLNEYDSLPCVKLGSIYDHNKRMGELGRGGNVNAARRFFDSMKEKNIVSYTSMMSIYLKNDEFHKAERIYFGIPEGMRNVVSDSAMVHAYAKAGRMEKAREVFDKMPERNVFSWTSLISGYFNLGEVGDAVELFGRMPDSLKNEVTWTNVIMGFARNGLIDEARGAFDRMPGKNVVAWTAMIKAYVEHHLVDEAFKLFEVMPQRNLYAWSIMLSGFLDHCRVNEAKELFDSMPLRNSVSWNTMVSGLARNGMIELARMYFDHMPDKDVQAWNAMITSYIDEGLMVEAAELFKLTPRRNIITWNAMIDGYSKNGQEDEAFHTLVLMLRNCIMPNEKSLTSLLTSCGGIHKVLQAHGLIVRLGFEIQTSLINTLITMYYKTGDLTSSQIAFKNLEAKDAVSWTSMIMAYSKHGLGKQALQALGQMLRSGFNPYDITFVGVLSACSHAGLVKKGQMLFDSIRRGYGLEPQPEHYSCLVDILGRAGLVNEAMKVVKEMPPDKCDGVVLRTLLGACRLHGVDVLADNLADELIEHEPDRCGGYVLLANVYAGSGKWDKLSESRKKMKERDVKKVPAFSRIDVNGRSRVFLVGDKSHPEMEETCLFLREQLLPQMQDLGSKSLIAEFEISLSISPVARTPDHQDQCKTADMILIRSMNAQSDLKDGARVPELSRCFTPEV